MSHVVDHYQNYKEDKDFFQQLLKLVNRFQCYPGAKWQITDSEKKELEELLRNLTPEKLTDRLEPLFDNQCFQLPELRNIKSDQQRFEKAEQIRQDAVNQIIAKIGVEAFVEYAINLSDPHSAMRAFAKQNNSFEYFDVIYQQAKRDQIRYKTYKDYFRSLAAINKDQYLVMVNNRLNDDFVWYLLAAATACEDIWNIVDRLKTPISREYWLHADLCVIPVEKADYLVSHFMTVGRYNEVINILFHILNDNKDNVDEAFVVKTMQMVMPILNRDVLRTSNFELEHVMEWIDNNEHVTDEEVMSLEIPYIISDRGNISDWRAYRIILQNPNYMFELIDYACFPDDETKRDEEITAIEKDPKRRTIGQFSAIMLTEIQTMPCVDKDGTIQEENLRLYVKKLLEAGREKDKLSHVYHTIGRLLGNYNSITTKCPPRIICELIDELDEQTVCNSYHDRIYNRLGSSVRGPYDGGEIERKKSERFDCIADELQIEYPITAKIYRRLARIYNEEAKRHDTEAEMLKLDD